MAAILEFYFRFWFYLFIVISMSFCIGLPNVIEIGPYAEHGSRRVTNTSGFSFSGDTHLRSKSICRPNFDEIFQSIAEWSPLPIFKDKWPPYWNSTSDFDFTYLLSLACHSLYRGRIVNFLIDFFLHGPSNSAWYLTV